MKSLVHRISQVPGEPIPYLCPALGSRPVCTGLTFSARAVQSPLQQQQRHQRCSYIGTQSHGFGIRCLRFKSCVTAHACKARFRLVVSLYREGVEPSGFLRKVSVLYIGLPPLPGLSWRDVEKLYSRGRSKILKALQATAISRHEGTLGRWARLPESSYLPLDACQTRIDSRTLTPQANPTAADLEFFNRIGHIRSSAVRCFNPPKRTLIRLLEEIGVVDQSGNYVPLVAGREAPPATRGARNAALWDIPDDSRRLLDSEAPQRLAAYIA